MPRPETGVTLVVCDTHDVDWVDAAKVQAAPAHRWDVLLLRVSAAWFAREHEAMLGRLPNVRLLNVGELACTANRDVSRFVVDLIHRLPSFDAGGRTVGQWFQEADQNLWWSLEIVEKSSFRGRVVERLYQLALVGEALRRETYDSVWLRVKDRQLAQVIAGSGVATVADVPPRDTSSTLGFAFSYASRVAAAIARFAAVRTVTALSGWRAPAVQPNALGIVTLFPYWWIAPFGDRPVERFFSAPPRSAAPHYVAWVTWAGAIWRQRVALKRTLQRVPLVPLQRFLRWRDVLGLLSLARFRRLAAARRAVLRHLAVRFGSFDVSSLVAEEIGASAADAELFFDHLVHASVRRYLESVRPAAVAYRVESQGWEHALERAAQTVGTPTVGFFHSMYGENYPALRFAPGELSGIDQGAGPRPIASRMLVPGATVERYLVADGYPRTSLAHCGPQRHASFVHFLRDRPSRAALRERLGLPTGVPVYFVAIAIVEAETEGVFACLEQALARDETFHLLIKTHPNRPRGDRSMHAALAAVPTEWVEFVPSGADMYDYLAAADTMVCIGSTVAFEAMALDVMPIVYEHAGTFAVTSLRAFEDSLYVVNSPRSMRAALDEVRQDGPGARQRRGRWRHTLAGVFGDMSTPLDEQMGRALARLGVAAGASIQARPNAIR